MLAGGSPLTGKDWLQSQLERDRSLRRGGRARLVRRTRVARPLRHSQARATSPARRGDFRKFQYLMGYKDPFCGHTR